MSVARGDYAAEVVPGPSRARVARSKASPETGDMQAAGATLRGIGEVLKTHGDQRDLLAWTKNMADLEVSLGMHATAARRLAEVAEDLLELDPPQELLSSSETFATAWGARDPFRAVRLTCAELAERERLDLPPTLPS